MGPNPSDPKYSGPIGLGPGPGHRLLGLMGPGLGPGPNIFGSWSGSWFMDPDPVPKPTILVGPIVWVYGHVYNSAKSH